MSQAKLAVEQLFDYETWTYTYLVWDPETKDAALIDPVKEQVERDLQLVADKGLKLNYILDTHVHADHVTGAGDLRAKTGAQTVVGRPAGIGCADVLIGDGESVKVGRFEIKALSTPGHTDACTSFLAEDMVFTGDSLFIRSCGRTDFQQGDPSKLFSSITEQLFTLPDETKVYPGHDYRGFTVSTIGEEKQLNPRIGGGKTEAEFVGIMNSLNLPKPKRIDVAVPVNQQCGTLTVDAEAA